MSTIAIESLFEDSDSISDAAQFLDEDQMSIDTWAMTDSSTPSLFGQESLNPSDSDDLASNVFSSQGMETMLIADASDECSNPNGNTRRIRRGGETFCSTQDSDSVPFDDSKLDWSSISDTTMTDFDRQQCKVDLIPSFLVCGGPDLSDPWWATWFALGRLDRCTRGMLMCLRGPQTLMGSFWIIYSAEDMSKCGPPNSLFCCRLYTESRHWKYEEWSSGQPLIVSVIRKKFKNTSCLTQSIKPKGVGLMCTPLL